MKHIQLFEKFTGGENEDEVRIELSNLYTLIGPKSNEEEARRIIAEMENEMKSEYEQALENSGESAAMDARDDVYFENGYKEILSKIGFEMED
jgi:hypothetical protein